MLQALHLKYRPQMLSELVGQNYVQITLSNAIQNERIAPAYMFTGVRGTGKTSTARILAKSLNCQKSQKPTTNPCGKCQSCRNIAKSTSFDVTEIDAASHNGVDDARDLIKLTNFAPSMSRYRVFIIDECHQLTTASQNCLLKAIEEPPNRVIFILCTTELHKVLPTIISRCQIFNFQALSTTTIVKYLTKIAEKESIEITENAVFAIVRTCKGSLRDALQLLSQLSLLNQEITLNDVFQVTGAIDESDLLKLVTAINQSNVYEILQIARLLIDSGKTPQLILSNLLAVYRDLLIDLSGGNNKNLIQGGISYQQLTKLVQGFNFNTINAAFTQLQKSESQLKTTLNAAIWLEVCLLNLVTENQQQLKSWRNDNNGKSLLLKPVKGKYNLNRTTKYKTVKVTPDLSKIWAEVIENAKPTNRDLLSHARLTSIDDNSAVLLVESKYFSKFQKSNRLLTKIVSKTISNVTNVVVKCL